MSRWPALVLIVALVTGAVLLGPPEPDDDVVVVTDPASLLPVAAPADALGSTWYCAGQSAGEGSDADGTLIIANAGEATAVGRVKMVSDVGERAELDLEVPALTTRRIPLAEHLEADWLSATVELDRGSVAVEHEIVGSAGRGVAPCHSRAADRWYLPTGVTTRDARLILAVYNPFPDSATVDMSFSTEAGVREPTDLQGLPVPARSMIAVDVTPVVTIRRLVATTVTTRRGRVVVDRIQGYDGRGASTTDEEAAQEAYRPKGLTLTPAVTAARPQWVFPAGIRTQGVHETISVFNPGTAESHVEVALALDDPPRNGELEPFDLVVAPGEVGVLEVDEAESVPDGVTHSITVSVVEGAPVVAERRLVTRGADVTYVDVATSTGSPVAGPTWLFATGRRATDVEIGRIVVTNPGTGPADITLRTLGNGELGSVPGGRFTLAPGARREVELGDIPDERLSILVRANAPVVAERRLLSRPVEGSGEAEPSLGIGASVSVGVPLPAGLVNLRP